MSDRLRFEFDSLHVVCQIVVVVVIDLFRFIPWFYLGNLMCAMQLMSNSLGSSRAATAVPI